MVREQEEDESIDAGEANSEQRKLPGAPNSKILLMFLLAAFLSISPKAISSLFFAQ